MIVKQGINDFITKLNKFINFEKHLFQIKHTFVAARRLKTALGEASWCKILENLNMFRVIQSDGQFPFKILEGRLQIILIVHISTCKQIQIFSDLFCHLLAFIIILILFYIYFSCLFLVFFKYILLSPVVESKPKLKNCLQTLLNICSEANNFSRNREFIFNI